MSLLREIQNDVASPGGDVVSVLRKCKILAARLGSKEFSYWVDCELNGYPESQETPEYRRLGTNCYANFMNLAWEAKMQAIPLGIFPEDLSDVVRQVDFKEGIAKATSFVTAGARINRPELIGYIQGKMYPRMNCVAAWIEISGPNFEQLISAVKNRILDFALNIEVENPDAGEAPLNSRPVPVEKLESLVNNFFGGVGNFAQNSHHFTQAASFGIPHDDLARLVTELTDHMDELHLAAHQKQRAEAQIATIKAQLTDEPDHIIVQQAGRTLRNILEGAIGGMLATSAQPSVWQWLHQILTRF